VKPPAFEYHDPRGLPEALSLLARLGDDAKVLAGGQSLVPLLNFRLARPAHLIDLNRVDELAYIREQDGAVAIGAMTRQRAAERDDKLAARAPLIRQALGQVGHVQIRNRGTIGGSLAHADPAAELPAVMLALDAQLVLRREAGERVVAPNEFFVSYLTTCLEPDELLVEIRLQALPPRTGTAFVELSRRHGDFALAGVAAAVTLDEVGHCASARIGLTGVAPTPVRPHSAEVMASGSRPTEALWREVAHEASRELQPDSDLHASGAYRKHIAEVLVFRALLEASSAAR
jgi:aerobic carbon-monoxide dehydrogenase medium subunit